MHVDDLDISPSKIGESAQRIIDRAIEESRRREHALLTNEHIFLAFAQVEWDMFAEVMRDIELNPHTILQAIEEHLHMMPSFAGRELRVSPATKLVFKLALHHQLGSLAQERDALPPAEVAPGRKDGLGRGDSLARLFAAAELKFAEHQAGVGGRGVGERAGFRLNRFAFDEHAMGSAEPGPCLLKRRIECLMKIFSQRTEGSVSDLFHNPGHG